MGLLSELQNRLKKSGLLIVFVLLFFYFSFYTINGERGLRRYLHLQQELSYAEKIADKYSREKAELEEKVRLCLQTVLILICLTNVPAQF